MNDIHEKVAASREATIAEYLNKKKNDEMIDGEDPWDILLAMPLDLKVLEVKRYDFLISTNGPGTSLTILESLGEPINIVFKVQDISGITRKDVTDNPTWREFAQLLLAGEA